MFDLGISYSNLGRSKTDLRRIKSNFGLSAAWPKA